PTSYLSTVKGVHSCIRTEQKCHSDAPFVHGIRSKSKLTNRISHSLLLTRHSMSLFPFSFQLAGVPVHAAIGFRFGRTRQYGGWPLARQSSTSRYPSYGYQLRHAYPRAWSR